MNPRLTVHGWRSALRAGVKSVPQGGRDLGQWLAVFVLRMARDWRREILAAATPLVLLGVLVRVPVIPAALRPDASIGTIAAVQGAVTGLSLVALVLAVELARRQEDRDDTVYDIMLRAAWIRPTFAFALMALLATLGAVAIADFSVVAAESRAANLLLCAYLLTGGVGVALLVAVLRTVHALRPTGVIEYRLRAIAEERREKVAAFISQSLNEYPRLGPIERLLLPHRPVGLTTTERLFVEIDDALQSGQAARLSGALQRLRRLIENSADQIAASDVGFQYPGRPPLGLWFPLDALQERLRELWTACFARPGHEFLGEMWSLEHWLVMTGVERRSGELLEIGLRSGLIGYQAAREARRSGGHAHHEWLNLKGAAWWRLTGVDGREITPAVDIFVRRLIEYFQEYGNMLLEVGDADSFRNMLVQFRQSYYDNAKRRWRSQSYLLDQSAPLSQFEYAVMASLALGGRAMTLREQGKLKEVGPYLDPISEMVGQISPMERYIPAAYEPETALHQQWGWWEMDGRDDGEVTFAWVAPEHYPMLPLLLNLLKSGSDEPLPSLRGYAQRLIDAWTTHADIILDLAEVAHSEREQVAEQFARRLATAKGAEEREAEDVHIAAPLDEARVSRFLGNLQAWREHDRILEACFEQVRRVRRLSEHEWGDMGRFARGWLLPRPAFVADVVPATAYAEWHDDRIVHGFELGLAAALTQEIEGSSDTHEAPTTEVETLLAVVDAALAGLDEGHQIIVFVGSWTSAVRSTFIQRMYHDGYSTLVPEEDSHYRVFGSYRGHQILWFETSDAPRVAVINLERWGWLVRAPVDGKDLGVGLEEIERSEAEERTREELPDEGNEAVLEERIRQLRLLVRAHAEERARFEVEDPDAARIIRFASDDGNHD